MKSQLVASLGKTLAEAGPEFTPKQLVMAYAAGWFDAWTRPEWRDQVTTWALAVAPWSELVAQRSQSPRGREMKRARSIAYSAGYTDAMRAEPTRDLVEAFAADFYFAADPDANHDASWFAWHRGQAA